MTARDYPIPPSPPPEAPPPLGHAVADHPNPEVARRLYEAMLLTRLVEERTVQLYRQGAITGGCYTGIGNEATSVGTAWVLGPDDVLVPTQRDMGSHLVRGHDPLEIFRQYLKRSTSQTEGKDGGLHLGKEGSNIVGMISHLAHMMPVAAGVALAERMQGRDTVVLTSVGDGATSLGDFHEALNFAAVQRLGVIFLIVNNQYAYSTPHTLQYACARLADRGLGYGIPGEQVDGTDIVAVLSASRRAMERARAGQGPTLLECVTMRMRGHSEHDDFKYVPPELLERWRRWDPLLRFQNYLRQGGIMSDTDFVAVQNRLNADIDRAVALAEKEPPPPPEAAARDVFRHWLPEWTVPSGEELP